MTLPVREFADHGSGAFWLRCFLEQSHFPARRKPRPFKAAPRPVLAQSHETRPRGARAKAMPGDESSFRTISHLCRTIPLTHFLERVEKNNATQK